MARHENNVPAELPVQTICFDEWNVWDSVKAPGHKLAEQMSVRPYPTMTRNDSC